MSGNIKQITLKLVFLAVLGSVFVFRSLYAPPPADTDKLQREAALERYGFYLQEVSKQIGIDFTHEAPALDAKLEHIMPIATSMGASVSVVDFDRDGWPDLYVINSAQGSKNRLYRNKGVDKDGKPLGFEDVAEKLGIADLNRPGDGACMGAIWGDFDNDGYEDLLVYRWGKPELYHNDQGKGFTRVTDSAGLPKWMNAGSAIWLDFDGDGLLDLFIAGYWADDIDLWNLKSTKIMPSSFHYARNGGSKHLLRNRGKDKAGKWLGFEDVTEKMGISKTGWTLAAAAADLRGTGHPDLVLAVDYGFTEYYANQKGKGFIEIGEKARLGEKSRSGMNVSFGDIYNDGRRAIYVSNITEPGLLLQFNNLWVPDRKPTGDHPTYRDLADTVSVARGGWSWGAQFGDLNNDGKLDLVLTNGYISADRHNSFWYDYSFIAGATTDISDAANWPKMKGQSLSGYQQHCLWVNRGGKFIDVAQAVGLSDTFDGRAVVLVDLWNRGVLDVVQASQKGPLLVYQNTVVKDNAWIQFELEGTRSNKSAIGAQVKVYWNDQVQIQEVSGGCGYAAQNQRRLHFGLGKDARIDRVEIRWPSGQTETIKSPQIGVLHQLKEQP
jgi:hypothetical protein